MILRWILGKNLANGSEKLYQAIMASARQEFFYAEWKVPDTIDGRFDVLALHVFLVMKRLRDLGAEGQQIAQQLADHFFADMDLAMREVGVGDLSVGKKVRKMAEAFYGRAKAYEAAMNNDNDAFARALARNIYAGLDATYANDLAAWARRAHDILKTQEISAFQSGDVRFA